MTILALTGIGMVTSLGHDAVTSCAAIRAGITRVSEIGENFLVFDEKSLDTKVVGHKVAFCTEGFYFFGKWIRLAVTAFEDMVKSSKLPLYHQNNSFWDKTAITFVLPVIDNRFDCTEEINQDYFLKNLVGPFFKLTGISVPKENIEILDFGHAGVIAAIENSSGKFQSKSVDRHLIICVDSYLDDSSLEWLNNQKRLKSVEVSDGVQPGEAGSCILIVDLDIENCETENVLAKIASYSLKFDKHNRFSEKQPDGIAISDSINSCLDLGGVTEKFSGDIVLDLNGDIRKSKDYSLAFTRLMGDKVSESINLIAPCENVGEIGAAIGGVSVCVVARSFAENYSTADASLVISVSDYGDVGSLYLERFS